MTEDLAPLQATSWRRNDLLNPLVLEDPFVSGIQEKIWLDQPEYSCAPLTKVTIKGLFANRFVFPYRDRWVRVIPGEILKKLFETYLFHITPENCY